MKKLNWGIIAADAVLGAFLGLFGSLETSGNAAHDWLLVTVGFVGFMFAVLSASFESSLEREALGRTPWELNRARRLGPFCWLLLVGLSITFMRMGWAGTTVDTAWMFWLSTFFGLSWWFVWDISKKLWKWNAVPPNTLIVLDGRVYGPGDRYSMRAWRKHEREKLDENLSLDPFEITYGGMQQPPILTTLTTTVRVPPILGGRTNIPDGGLSFDKTEFLKKAATWVESLIRERWLELPFTELVTKKRPMVETEIDGITVQWLGQGTWSVET